MYSDYIKIHSNSKANVLINFLICVFN
jgi:hypothetical protein